MAKPKRVAILGSTGSIGTQALDVIRKNRERFRVAALAAGKQTDKLHDQVREFGVSVYASAQDGPAGLLRVATESDADIVLAATDGFVSFDAVFAAVERGIDIAVANKELIVAAGELLIAAARRSGSKLLPVDSEHSAIFQCLAGEDPQRVQSIVLTASGGPFRTKTAQEMADATLDAALAHPTWRMGVKNTVDSATMMNKGLEVIEASRLFGLPGERVQILVHPQSIAHGLVVFTDGSVKIQAAAPDMRLPIGYALAYPDRLGPSTAVDVAGGDPLRAAGAHPEAASLRYDFERADAVRFPCIRLAYEALAAGGTMPAVLSAANEIAVAAYVDGAIRFGSIAAVIERVMADAPAEELSLDGVRRADAWARTRAKAAVEDARGRIEV
ncbi:MAG TPA: 1-deoxy-D-xylulose-5-phosphate reductoisomerase [Candidatus Baltobacteraceae bacterium]|nr:1-deoxy-D-xylulose-5-phosphate reductoisomerase [Candidatus Baltobacteraceae bacterium]